MSSPGLETKSSVAAGPTHPLAGANWTSALRGVWSLTWKNRLSLKRLPMLAASLALIPLLAYLTIDDGLVRPYLRWVIDF